MTDGSKASREGKSSAVYTIGHGSRSIEEFVGLLTEHGVRVLVDVRRFPASKTGHFRREEMERWLAERGIQYVWLGRELGGFRRGGYEAQMETEAYRDGIRRLLDLAGQGTVALMCLEVSPRGCHRRHISRTLSELGAEVVHIIKEGVTLNQRDLEAKRSPGGLSHACKT